MNIEDILRELRGAGDAGLTIAKQAAMQPFAGVAGLANALRAGVSGGDPLEAALGTIEGAGEVAGGPRTAEGARNLQRLGGAIQTVTDPLMAQVDKVGALSPSAGAALVGLGGVIDPVKGGGRAAAAAKRAATAAEAAALRAARAERGAVGLSPGELGELGVKDPAMVRSFRSNFAKKGEAPVADVEAAVANRARLMEEPATTPGPNATEAEWAAWGERHGVDMTRSPDISFSDVKTRNEFTLPGGLEGRFTIPDLFQIKANNFDPNLMSDALHTDLMSKFLRTHRVEAPDAVDKFNRLSFAQLSPNAPLTQNEFMAQRYRLRDKGELDALAARAGEEGLDQSLNLASGVGAGYTGGMGVRGTARADYMADLARQLRDKPEMFETAPGETVRDMTKRVMNQTPGLSTKTGSLATPWLDLERANVSAVDLHGVRNNWKQLLDDPDVGAAFTDRMRGLMAKRGWVKPDATPDEIRAVAAKMPTPVEKLAISVIGGSKDVNYRLKGGKLNPAVEPSVAPEKLLDEPTKYQQFNPFYEKVMQQMEPPPGSALELFPEQWRKWDRYRGRVEPHEFAHPDFRKLPRQSFSEMAAALQAHKDAGYMATPRKIKTEGAFDEVPKAPVPKRSDWRRLYYGKADPTLLALTAGGVGGGLALANALRGEQ